MKSPRGFITLPVFTGIIVVFALGAVWYFGVYKNQVVFDGEGYENQLPPSQVTSSQIPYGGNTQEVGRVLFAIVSTESLRHNVKEDITCSSNGGPYGSITISGNATLENDDFPQVVIKFINQTDTDTIPQDETVPVLAKEWSASFECVDEGIYEVHIYDSRTEKFLSNALIEVQVTE